MEIKFRSLTYKNIMSVGNAPITIQLDAHPTTILVGHNGAGKSTVLEALTFALFGRAFRKINKSQLINSINGKQLLVTITFDVGGVAYAVSRGIKPDVFTITADGTEIKRVGSATDYQKTLEQIIGMNFSTFSQVVVLSASNFTPFMQLDSPARRAVIEDILDIKVFGTMAKLMKSDVTAAKERLSAAESAIGIITNKQEVQERYIDNLRQDNNRRKQELRDSIAAADAVITEIESKLSAADSHVTQIKGELDGYPEVDASARKLRGILDALKSKRRETLGKLDFYENSECPTCKQPIPEESKAEVHESVDKKVSELDVAINKCSSQIDDLTIRLTAYIEVNKRLSAAKDQHRELQNSLIVEMRNRDRLSASLRTLETSGGGDIATEIDNLTAIRESLQVAIQNKTEAIAEKEAVDACSAILKDGGFKAQVIEYYLPLMNQLIEKYLHVTNLWVSFVLDNEFNEEIKSRYRDGFSYYSFSEGEKQRIDLAILFAWRSIAKMKNSVSCNVLFFDEILDRCLDVEGVDAAMSLLYTLSGTHVFVISHKADLLMDRFRSVLFFKKENNFTVMQQEVNQNASTQ